MNIIWTEKSKKYADKDMRKWIERAMARGILSPTDREQVFRMGSITVNIKSLKGIRNILFDK